MHVTKSLWIILWTTMPCMINIRADGDQDIPRENLLRAILWEEREFEEIEKRAFTLPQHNGLTDCCPSRTREIAPVGGLSREGKLLQLFRDSRIVQRFYETTCAPEVLNRSCNFVDPNRWTSRCVQNYTYMYAIVKDYNVTQPYRVDYMRMKSGCTCKVEDRPTIIEIETEPE